MLPLEMEYKPQPLEIKLEKIRDYTLISELGHGSFGAVYLALDAQGRVFAIKKLNLTTKYAKENKFFEDEVKINESLSHENVVKYYTNFKEKEFLYIVCEYCNQGDLRHYIKRRLDLLRPIGLKERLSLLKNICQAKNICMIKM
jgi:serine/threonine protein kinase